MLYTTLIKITAAITHLSQAFFIPEKRGFGDAEISVDSKNITGIVYTGGEYLLNISNSSTGNTTVYAPYVNTTNVTISELANATSQLNATDSSSDLTDLVITVGKDSLERAGFYYALSFPNQTVVVTQNTTKGLFVANNTNSTGRGGLIVDNEGIIYSGITYPHSVIGAVDPHGKVTYFFDPALPALAKVAAVYYKNHSAEVITKNLTNSSQVPIINATSSSKKVWCPKASKLPTIGDITVVNINSTKEISQYTKKAANSSSNSWTILASNNLIFIPPNIAGSTHSNVIGAGILSPIQASVLASFVKAAGAGFLAPVISALG